MEISSTCQRIHVYIVHARWDLYFIEKMPQSWCGAEDAGGGGFKSRRGRRILGMFTYFHSAQILAKNSKRLSKLQESQLMYFYIYFYLYVCLSVIWSSFPLHCVIRSTCRQGTRLLALRNTEMRSSCSVECLPYWLTKPTNAIISLLWYVYWNYSGIPFLYPVLLQKFWKVFDFDM